VSVADCVVVSAGSSLIWRVSNIGILLSFPTCKQQLNLSELSLVFLSADLSADDGVNGRNRFTKDQ